MQAEGLDNGPLIGWLREAAPQVTRRCPVSRQAAVTVNDTMILPVLPNGSYSYLLREYLMFLGHLYTRSELTGTPGDAECLHDSLIRLGE